MSPMTAGTADPNLIYNKNEDHLNLLPNRPKDNNQYARMSTEIEGNASANSL